MKEFKESELRSGKIGPGKGKKVKDRKQAVAIALSEAREAGANIPEPVQVPMLPVASATVMPVISI